MAARIVDEPAGEAEHACVQSLRQQRLHGALVGGDLHHRDLAHRLGAATKHLVHRDFQSQNFMLVGDEAYWIDFQGMRRGRQEYDLASLIYDPYMDHSKEDRERLLDLWEEVSEERPVEKLFQEVAIQRLMQAMGAFGNIIWNREDEWYKQHVPVAAKLLTEVAEGTPFGDLLEPFLEKAAAFK